MICSCRADDRRFKVDRVWGLSCVWPSGLQFRVLEFRGFLIQGFGGFSRSGLTDFGVQYLGIGAFVFTWLSLSRSIQVLLDMHMKVTADKGSRIG